MALTCSQSQLWPNEITSSQGWGELSPRKVETHPLEPSGTLGLCNVATWCVLAEVLRTWSTEGRPQGGGSSCHLRWEELGAVIGDNDIKPMWVSHVSAQSYIPYQQRRNPLCAKLWHFHFDSESELLSYKLDLDWLTSRQDATVIAVSVHHQARCLLYFLVFSFQNHLVRWRRLLCQCRLWSTLR